MECAHRRKNKRKGAGWEEPHWSSSNFDVLERTAGESGNGEVSLYLKKVSQVGILVLAEALNRPCSPKGLA